MDEAAQKHLKRFYPSRKLLVRNIEITRQVVECGLSYAEAAGAFGLSKVQIYHIIERMIRNVELHAAWLGRENPWTQEKFPHAYHHYASVNKVYFTPRMLKLEELRGEKDYILDVLLSLRMSLAAYVALREKKIAA